MIHLWCQKVRAISYNKFRPFFRSCLITANIPQIFTLKIAYFWQTIITCKCIKSPVFYDGQIHRLKHKRISKHEGDSRDGTLHDQVNFGQLLYNNGTQNGQPRNSDTNLHLTMGAQSAKQFKSPRTQADSSGLSKFPFSNFESYLNCYLNLCPCFSCYLADFISPLFLKSRQICYS